MMAHKDVHIAGLHMLVRPNYRMIAAHLGGGVRRIRRLINVGQHVNIGTRRLVVRVPLLLLYYERWRNIRHYRMRVVFYDDGRGGKLRDVILETDSTHEPRKPPPHLVPIEFTQ